MIWFIWALNLIAQNFAFTFVSRARNSGSIQRHVIASLFSNGIWIMQIQILFGAFMDYLTGKHGRLWQIAVGIYYTVFTVSGAVFAHYWSLKNEKGKAQVGASSKRAEITPVEWETVKKALNLQGII